jgi:phage replication O-like protein O
LVNDDDDEVRPPRQENNEDMPKASSEVRYPANFETYQERRQSMVGEKEPCAKEGFTQIPNAILDQHLSKINSIAELKITLYVIRKTLGYQKTWDRISHSQFEEATGLSSQSVKNGLKAALKSGLVIRRGDGQYFQYSIQLGKKLAHFDEKVGQNLAQLEDETDESGTKFSPVLGKKLAHFDEKVGQNLAQLEDETDESGTKFSPVLGKKLAHFDEKVGQNLAPQKKESLNKNLKKDEGDHNGGFSKPPPPPQPPAPAPEFQKIENQYQTQPEEAIPKYEPIPAKTKTRAEWKSDPRILAWQRFAKLKGFRREHGYFPELAQARHILENIPNTPEQLDRWSGLIEIWLDKRFFIGNIYDLVDVFINGWKSVGRSPSPPTRPPVR